MNEMEIGALQGALTRIKEMVFEDPSQPIKNVSHLLEAVEHPVHPTPPTACEDCGSVDPQVHYSNCPLAKTAGR